MDTTNYFACLKAPPTIKEPASRKVWSIDLEKVWVKVFIATNAMGDSAIPSAALGAPLRLAYDKAGAVRFSQAGRPIIRVASELSDSIRALIKQHTAFLIGHIADVQRDNPDGYAAQVALAQKAGEPIKALDARELSKALEAKAVAEAEATAKAEAMVQAEEAVKVKGRNKVRDLVPA